MAFTLLIVLSLGMCACGEAKETNSDNTPDRTNSVTEAATEPENATAQANAVELTLENVEQYLSFEVSKEMSEINPDAADHVLKVSPLTDGNYSGVTLEVEVPLYDNWYNSYTKEIDLSASITLTKVGKATVKHSIFFDVANLYETRGIQGEDDPTYIIKSVSGTVK